MRLRTGKTLALAGLLLLTLTALSGENTLAPYRETLPDGTVDWDAGWIRTEASVPLTAGVPRAQAVVESRRTALVKAQAAALRLAMRLPVDAERRLESFEALKVRVRGIVQGGRILSEETRGDRTVVSLEVPINGVHGIVSEVAVVTLPPPEPEPPAPPPQARSREAAPAPPPPPQAPASSLASFGAVTVDGREAGLKPALQMRIVDPQGNEVYGPKTVKPLRAREAMLARYVTAPPEPRGTSGSAVSSYPYLTLALIAWPPLELAQREPSPRPRGEEGLVVRAASARGTLRADVVVTEEEAARLREADRQSGILREGKVRVVVRPDVGGVEGRKLSPSPGGDLWLAVR